MIKIKTQKSIAFSYIKGKQTENKLENIKKYPGITPIKQVKKLIE